MTDENKPSVIPLITVDGLPWPKDSFAPENLYAIQNLDLKPNDIVMSVFPKAGTHWVKYIVWEILHKGETPPLQKDMNIPFVDRLGVDKFDTLPSPRSLVTHVPMNRLPFRDYVKYIYVTRNPFDACVSYFHFLLSKYKDAFTFDEFFEDFLKGRNPYGDFFDHFHYWYSVRTEPNIMMITYDEINLDRRESVLKIARFLGEDYAKMFETSEAMMETVLKQIGFDYMKEKLDLKTQENTSFLRKGIVGDWKKYFSEDQKNRLLKKMKDRLAGTEVLDYWLSILDL